MSVDFPRISVVVATRDRPERLLRCIASVLSCHHESFELIVVDQSVEPAEILPIDDRLTYLHSKTRGKCAGLNIALARARGEILAFTDDDCTVPSDWLKQAESVFDSHPEVALAFGQMDPADHDPSQVFIPPATVEAFRIVRSPRDAYIRGGAGGDMVGRRDLFDRIGKFDELIGPGARFVACEEYDIYFRALMADQVVAFAPELVVVHWGGRSYGDGSGQMLKRGYSYGEGAVMGKHLRMRERAMLTVFVRITLEDLVFILGNLRHRRLTGVGQVAHKWLGLANGLLTPVDRRRHVFVER